MAASRSESACSRSWETAISRPSEDTAMASTTPAVWVANRSSSQVKSAAAAVRSMGSSRSELLLPVGVVTARLLPGLLMWRGRWIPRGRSALLLCPAYGGLEFVELRTDRVGVDGRAHGLSL